MSGVPYSSNETDPDVGPRPATWYDGTPITTETVWQQLVRHDRESITGRIGSQPANKSDTIWGILSADDGQGSAGKALIVDNTGVIANLGGIGVNTTTPTERLHIVNGDVLVENGTINVGKDQDQTAHFGRGRISHFNITNSQTGATTSSVSFSHHDCALSTDFALLQTEDGETIINSATGKHTEFRLGGAPKMRVHTNGYIGINQQAPAEYLDVGGNIKASGIVVATNIKNYYQTVNSENNTLGDKSSTTQITNAGCPSTASDWTRYLSWKTSGVDTVNSNTNVFSPQNYGFKALVAGTYKITVNIAIQAQGVNQSIVIRLAKNALNDEVADSDQENPGPLAGTGYIPGFTGSNTGKINSFGSASITHITNLAVDDEVSIYTVNTGQVHSGSGVNSFTREGYSQFLAEYLG